MEFKAFAALGRACLLAMGILLAGSAAGAPASSPAEGKHTILVVGDSISAGYGLPRDTGWVKLLGDRLEQQRVDYIPFNASVSGDTTSGGRSRLPGLLASVKPAVVVIELGGNDGLRGLPLTNAADNLAAMIKASQEAHARVLLIGMQLPPNFGKTYTDEFSAMYTTLAGQFHVRLVPSFFAGFGEKLEMFQGDQIHPTQAGQPLLLDNVWPQLKPLLTDAPLVH